MLFHGWFTTVSRFFLVNAICTMNIYICFIFISTSTKYSKKCITLLSFVLQRWDCDALLYYKSWVNKVRTVHIITLVITQTPETNFVRAPLVPFWRLFSNASLHSCNDTFYWLVLYIISVVVTKNIIYVDLNIFVGKLIKYCIYIYVKKLTKET